MKMDQNPSRRTLPREARKPWNRRLMAPRGGPPFGPLAVPLLANLFRRGEDDGHPGWR